MSSPDKPTELVVSGYRFKVAAGEAALSGLDDGPLQGPADPHNRRRQPRGVPSTPDDPSADVEPGEHGNQATPEPVVVPAGDQQSDAQRAMARSTATPLAVTGQYLPGLDGIRALAVAGVLAYHLGFGWASGGYLGVDLFFVLSGFLITTLLLEEWVVTARIKLAAFWARRARRLLPALFLMLAAIALFVVLDGRFGPAGSAAQFDLSGLRGDGLATLFYVANWHSIFAHQSYFAQFSAPSPLQHTWSLAIEEQFYLLWPLVLLGLLSVFRGNWRRAGVVLTVVGAVGSALLMALLFHGGDPTRDYFGTDTRIFDMLAGATIAMVAAARPQPGPRLRMWLHVLAPLAAVALGYFWVTAGDAGGLPKSWMFRGGFFVCALLGAVVVADVRQLHQGPLAVVLSLRPLRWIGMVSYGIYLWHWPIFVYLNSARTHLSGARLQLLQVGVTLVVAAVSFYLVERPIRQRRFAGWIRFTLAPAVAAVTAVAIVVATVPAVAAPNNPAPSVAAVAPTGTQTVPGSGGYSDQTPITLAPGRVPSAAAPLEVMLTGDSVMNVAAPGITAALGATGVATAQDKAIDGFGFSNDPGWRASFTGLIGEVHPDLIVATWSWDDSWAQQNPTGYTATLEAAIRLMLTPGDGVSGVIFTQFPPTGPVLAPTVAQQRVDDAQRAAGQAAWDRIVRAMPAVFPGKVMYLPVASSVLLAGRFTQWLPPANDPGAPKSQWTRVRMVDDVHLCPAGVVRYADAVLSDLSDLFHLPAAQPGWWNQSWVNDPRYNTPPGSCPNDHPPG